VNRFVADFVGNANFLPVKRRGAQWLLPDDTALTVCSDTQHVLGDQISALVRPEVIHIEDHLTTIAHTDMNRLKGTVINSVFLGQHIEHSVRVAGLELRAFSRHPLHSGQNITLCFHANDCRLLGE
jgi:iron(III) transport system ATP-binding protein